MESAFPPRNLWKDPCASFIGTDDVWLEVRNRKEEWCAWSLVAITSHIISLTLTAFLRLVVRSLSLFLSNPCLTFLSSSCTSSTLNPVYSLIHVYHQAIPWWFCNLLPLYSIGARVSLISREYSTWRRSTLKPCGHDLNRVLVYPSCPNVPEKIIFDAPMSIQLGSPYPMEDVALTLRYEKVYFFSKLSLELLDQEDWIMKCNTSRVMKHNSIQQGAMSPTHKRKSCMKDRKVFLLWTILISSFLHDQCALHRFLCFPPPFINLGTRFLSRGRAVTPRVTLFPNYLHYKLNQASSVMVNQVIEVQNHNSKLGVQIWGLKFCLV
jgi:hypothetical protein